MNERQKTSKLFKSLEVSCSGGSKSSIIIHRRFAATIHDLHHIGF